MPAFPQLISGASVQYPINRRRTRRTIRSRSAAGYTYTHDDPGAGEVRWDVPLLALSDDELAAIATLFTECSGRLRTFTFLDPAANLLSWSETFTHSGWTRGPALQTTAPVADPWGTQRATRFICAGQAPQSVRQTLAVPGSFVYCLSAYARSAGGADITLVSGSRSETFPLDAGWRRVVSTGVPGGTGSDLTFGLEFAPGAMVEVYGLQLEAQVAPSDYMVTRGSGGVYSTARFDQDEFRVTTQSQGLTDATLAIVSSDVEQP